MSRSTKGAPLIMRVDHRKSALSILNRTSSYRSHGFLTRGPPRAPCGPLLPPLRSGVTPASPPCGRPLSRSALVRLFFNSLLALALE